MGNLISGEDFSGLPTTAAAQPTSAEPDWSAVSADLRAAAEGAAPDGPGLRRWSGKLATAAAQVVLNALADAIERNLARSKLQPMPDHDDRVTGDSARGDFDDGAGTPARSSIWPRRSHAPGRQRLNRVATP